MTIKLKSRTSNLLCLGIPTVNQGELFQEFLQEYENDYWQYEDIIVIDNGDQELKRGYVRTQIHTMAHNIGVAASWNLILRIAFGMDLFSHVAIYNDDVLVKQRSEVLVNLVDACEGDLILGDYDFSAFIMSFECWRKVGDFDENFKGAYFEDNDFLIRCQLAGCKIVYDTALNPQVFNRSSSIRKDPSLNENFERNKQYYIEKWGGVPTEEKFTKPFNGRKRLPKFFKTFDKGGVPYKK